MAVVTKKLKEQEMCNKTNTKYEHYNKIILKLQQRLKSEAHYLPTKEINKIALSSNDDKKLQNLNKITWCKSWKSMQNRAIECNFLQYLNTK